MAPSAIHSPRPSQQGFIDPDDLRTKFPLAMLAMYKKEVPLYGDLIKIVIAMRNGDVASKRLDLERHGAIRLRIPLERQTVRRIFAIIGLYPVGYYDLTPAGLPIHTTYFRPICFAALKRNPFRVFTTLLRPDLLEDAQSKNLALDLLSKRKHESLAQNSFFILRLVHSTSM
ncbi:hypothetical protein P171DRAFT_520686 [Karstenula rhodostoma CBS 690.94]|uniref:2-oxoadipate dioxygenase/decarboxylase n=1 Tax=Karstenula rhodostoma CBS 690.94 TaxID=1392251 RepID=A0A9P4UDB1_9PLEO|nr:hypothetical protein P171DRAFT_520686 [Karstenula rhodostoma CBS 690.94]